MTMTAVPLVSKTLMCGNVQVQAKIGAFENETPDCLLVFWNKEFLDKISDKRMTGNFKKGEILVTPGGKLKCSEIINVACHITTISTAAGDGLMRADSDKMKTVVIPIMHNDTLIRAGKIYCTGILTAIKKLATILNFVLSVKLVIESEHDFLVFNEVFEESIYGTGNKCTGFKTLELWTKPSKVEHLQQKEFDFFPPDSSAARGHTTNQTHELRTNFKENNRDVVTAHHMDNARDYVESFENEPNNKRNEQSKNMYSSISEKELYRYIGTLDKMTEVEFKALEIFEKGFKRMKTYVNISWIGDAIAIDGPVVIVDSAKRDLTSRLRVLRNKQSDEIVLSDEDKKYVKDIIGEVQSRDTICVYDDKKSRVVVYSDKQDDIIQFKHQLKFRTGKVKESGRKVERFAEETQSLRTSQENLSSSVRSTDIQHEFSCPKDASNVKIFYTKEHIMVAIYNANILNLPVDCIVNAANDNLDHIGGVAKVISDAAGPELVQQGNALIMEQRNGKVPVGCQVTTTAGRLHYKCVIHTVGPRWSDYQPHTFQNVKDCEKDLYAAIYGCFTRAEKNGLSTIALPAVSSGTYAVPQEICAVQYAKAVLDYSRNSRQGKALTEIHFIDKLPHLVKLMQDTFRTMFENGKVPNYNIQNYAVSSSSYRTEQSPLYYETTVQHIKQFVFQVSAKPVVCIYEGDILKVKNMDAMVCSVDINGIGKESITLELEKNIKYKKQKHKCFESTKPDLGDVVVICGNKTPFKMIVHVVIENNSPQKPEFKSTMKKSIDNILRKTDECVQVKNIALPLFGVEQELLTEKSWAKLFLERFVAFCHEVKNPNLEEVHILTHCSSSSAYPTVKKVFRKYADERNKTPPQEKVPPPRPPPPKNCRMSDQKQDHMSGTKQESEIDKGDSDDSCTICMCPKVDPKSLSCGHSFCSECIDQMFKHKPVCPICGTIVGTLTGDQPDNGKMDVKTSSTCLAGYEGYGCIVITYDFPAGKQGPSHPSPGTFYDSMKRAAYLPNNPEGRTVCKMLQLAFDRRLMFTISQSRTTGKEGLTWNDIHHKTNPKPGGQFGYPDPEYLSRVKDELAAKGITEADLPQEESGLSENESLV